LTAWHEWRDAPEAEYAVVGDPIAHSLSPLIHAAAYAALDMPYRYRAVRVPHEEFEEALDFLRVRGYRGLNVTLPLKEAAFAWCESVDDAARPLGSVNTLDLSTRRGTSTDGAGFVASLKPKLCPFLRFLVLGAGGSARSVAYALVQAGYDVALWNRTRERAEALGAELGIDVLDTPDPFGFHVVVNATSLGHQGMAVPIDWSVCEPSTLAYDLSYGDAAKPFLQPAATHGLNTMDGLDMLVEQAATAFEWWFGVPAPRQAMVAALP